MLIEEIVINELCSSADKKNNFRLLPFEKNELIECTKIAESVYAMFS